MVDKSSIQFDIDARSAKAGADAVDKAITRINKAMTDLKTRTESVNRTLSKPLNTQNFTKLADGIKKVANLKVDGSLTTNLNKLSNAMNGMRMIKKPVADSLDRFRAAVSQFNNINLSKKVVTGIFVSLLISVSFALEFCLRQLNSNMSFRFMQTTLRISFAYSRILYNSMLYEIYNICCR